MKIFRILKYLKIIIFLIKTKNIYILNKLIFHQ